MYISVLAVTSYDITCTCTLSLRGIGSTLNLPTFIYHHLNHFYQIHLVSNTIYLLSGLVVSATTLHIGTLLHIPLDMTNIATLRVHVHVHCGGLPVLIRCVQESVHHHQ